MDKINIFIAHHHEDEKHIEGFKKKLGDHYDVRDSSIVETDPNNANNPDYIKSTYLKPSIDWAGKLIVLVSSDTKNSNPDCGVDWEVEYANKKGYPIIAVYTPGATENDLTQGLRDYADSYVSWNDNSGLVNAIDGTIVSDSSGGGQRPFAVGGGVVC